MILISLYSTANKEVTAIQDTPFMAEEFLVSVGRTCCRRQQDEHLLPVTPPALWLSCGQEGMSGRIPSGNCGIARGCDACLVVW